MLVDGEIPKNTYGNIEIWAPHFVPQGCTHLTLPGIVKIAESININCVPALVDWEIHRGRNVPVLDGGIVLDCDVSILNDAFSAAQELKWEKERARRSVLSRKRWVRFTKKILLRNRLQTEYGPY